MYIKENQNKTQGSRDSVSLYNNVQVVRKKKSV